MTEQDPNFKDDTGVLAIIVGLVVVVALSALPATIGVLLLVG